MSGGQVVDRLGEVGAMVFGAVLALLTGAIAWRAGRAAKPMPGAVRRKA
jgi:hypothetical protein